MTTRWETRYPDLAGRAAVLTGDSPVLVEIAATLASNGVLIAVVCADRDVVSAAVEQAEQHGVAVFGLTADPTSPEVWTRLGAHIEQRLAPIDVIVACGASELRAAVLTTLVPDMRARRRGAVIEISDADSDPVGFAPGPGLRHRHVRRAGLTDTDLAAVVLLGASDTISAAALSVGSETAGQSPG